MHFVQLQLEQHGCTSFGDNLDKKVAIPEERSNWEIEIWELDTSN